MNEDQELKSMKKPMLEKFIQFQCKLICRYNINVLYCIAYTSKGFSIESYHLRTRMYRQYAVGSKIRGSLVIDD